MGELKVKPETVLIKLTEAEPCETIETNATWTGTESNFKFTVSGKAAGLVAKPEIPVKRKIGKYETVSIPVKICLPFRQQKVEVVEKGWSGKLVYTAENVKGVRSESIPLEIRKVKRMRPKPPAPKMPKLPKITTEAIRKASLVGLILLIGAFIVWKIA